jgi:hypothetical protein
VNTRVGSGFFCAIVLYGVMPSGSLSPDLVSCIWCWLVMMLLAVVLQRTEPSGRSPSSPPNKLV